MSRKRRIGDGEDVSAAKKPKQPVDEDSDVAEDAGEEEVKKKKKKKKEKRKSQEAVELSVSEQDGSQVQQVHNMCAHKLV